MRQQVIGGEVLARRLDEADRTSLDGLSGINEWIQRAVYERQAGAGLSYEAALRAVALAQPAIFLTKARAELGQVAYGQAVYFSLVNGQLVDPCIIDNGALKRLDSPLDTRALPGILTVDQEIALRVAEKMQRPAESGVTMDYGQALKVVASECPRLTRDLYARPMPGRFGW